MKLAVYGTLKRGHGNHDHFMTNYTFLGEDTIKGDLFVHGLPYAKPGDGIIHVEVYEVPHTALPGLDSFEGHPNLYKRTPVMLNRMGVEAMVYMYQGNVTGAKKRENGVF